MPDTFICGFLTAIVIILVIALVAGIAGIVVLFKRTRDLKNINDDIYRSLSQTSDYLHRRMDGEIQELEKNCKSTIDKQINLLENRLKENK